MRRFLDWTAAQTASQSAASSAPPTKANTQHGQTKQHHHQLKTWFEPTANSARDLELQHLQKLLHEIKYYQASSSPLPSAAGSQSQREFVDKVHKTLPLFLNVFGNITLPIATSSGHLHIASIEQNTSCHSSQECLEQSTHNDSVASSKPNSPLPPQTAILHMDRFPDLLPFAFTVARLFVSEVRQRASNKHAEEAAITILDFLNVRSTGVKEQCLVEPGAMMKTSELGWNLLLSLNALASSQSSQILQLLCDASLPSTLIKCLYLFFDLPISIRTEAQTNADQLEKPSENTSDIDVTTGDQDGEQFFSRAITSGPLIKAFTQLAVQLCSHQAAIDELIKKDDLRLLIGIASSQCLPHNRPWRKAAFHILIAISKNMRDNFIYLEQNLCINNYVENMNRIISLGLASTDEYIEMIKALIEFLYNLDVNNRNQANSIGPIINQFKESRIVDLIEELLIKIDETIILANQLPTSTTQSDSAEIVDTGPSLSNRQAFALTDDVNCICIDDYRQFGKLLTQSLITMAKINISCDAFSSIVNMKPLAMTRFEMFEQFKMPKPSAKNCILNYEALKLLKNAWSKCRDSHIIEAILDATISLFNDDKFNYFIFESQQLLVYYMTSYNFKLFPLRVKQKLFKFLEFIVIETNYIPCLELGTLGTIVKKKASMGMDLVLGLKTLIACLRFNPRFSDIFREIGLLEIVVELLIQNMQQDNLNAEKLEVLYLLMEASQLLLAGPNNMNCIQFNEKGAARHVFNCISNPEFFHLFAPTHSSSSDDGGGLNSKSGTPSSAGLKSRQTHVHYAQQSNWVDGPQSRPTIKQLQKVAFTIIRQLILSTAGDEHLANLLGLLARNLDDLKHFETSATDKQATNCESTPEVGEAVSIDNHQSPQPQSSRLTFLYLMSQEVNLKICILKSLMIIFKDSHRCRTLFRKAGGFIYIVSSLVTLEKSLPSIEAHSDSQLESYAKWKKINSRRIWRLVKNSLITIVVAIRFEPANLRAFSESNLKKFTEALRKLGCFKEKEKTLPDKTVKQVSNLNENFSAYRSIFLAHPSRDYSTLVNDNIKPTEACCQLFRFLYDMSLDLGDGTAELEIHLEKHMPATKVVHQYCTNETKSISFDQGASTPDYNATRESVIFKRRSQLNMAPRRPPSLDLNSTNLEPAILTFPCIVLSLLDLIPSCPSDDLMVFTCLAVKSLFKHERNQQMLCEAGMVSKLLSPEWRISLVNKNHFLHETVKSMLECLTKQSVSPKELRTFLRLGEPMRCKNLDIIEANESSDETRKKLSELSQVPLSTVPTTSISIKPHREKIPTDRIESLVGMMSDEKSKIQPPFIEFDMNFNGLSSIFMPSIAPINAKYLPPNSSSFLNSTLDVHTSEKNGILGGVGSSDRQFPPLNGLTFSTWICIEKFPSRSSDSMHNLRLLTIYRGSAATGKEFSCFRVQISALDRALTISTQESLLFDNEARSDTQQDPDCNLRIWTPELLVEGRWHHVAITLNRSLMKQSTISVYVDGALVHQQRISYISSYVGTVNTGPLGNPTANNVNCSAAAYVNAFIGSLPQLRFHLKTHWKQGPCNLVEEHLSANFIGVIYALGPDFIGSFQSPKMLCEIARKKNIQQLTLKNSYHNHQETPSHRPLIHQQSAAVTQTHHKHNSAPLTRVSSSNLSSATSSGGHSTTSHACSSGSQSYHFPEERILMSIDARATSLMTLSRMRRIYTRFDCRQVSRVLGLTLHESSTPILLLHNTGVHLNGPSRGIGAVTIGYNQVRCFVPSPTQNTLITLGGCYILLGFVAQAHTVSSFSLSLRSLVTALKYNAKLQAQMEQLNGYQILSVFFWKKKHLLREDTLRWAFSLISNSEFSNSYETNILPVIGQVDALRDLICECFDLWLQTDMISLVLEFIYSFICSSASPEHYPSSSINSHSTLNTNLLPSNSVRLRNLKYLRDMDLLPRMLRLLPQYDSHQTDSRLLETGIKSLLDNNTQELSNQSRTFDTKAVYLIKQTVFELLNRTPRQSDILYFGQFLASLLPSKVKEREPHTIKMRNVLLKSLLQMMTKNNQKEVNHAMQEELVRILGFDWFMLFISGSHLDTETINIGFLNLMLILSNDNLYSSFKSKSTTNGGWLKEPVFPTMDGKFNIQLLGINVGVFFGLSGNKKAIKHEVLMASNFFLLSQCLEDLIELPRIYLMLFHTMMNRLSSLDSNVLDSIESFNKLSLDLLCDCLVGDTHHKRRQVLSNVQFRCHDLVVCLVYMIREIMVRYNDERCVSEYPIDVTRFLMYLYNNNQEFQAYCRRSDELVDALCACLVIPDSSEKQENEAGDKLVMTKHKASKEILELSRLIILDTISDQATESVNEIDNDDQLKVFERFLDSMSNCMEAQGELVDLLLRQILLMIDSTARHNSIKTIGGSENIIQFQLLLINSISISEIITDKIWLQELYTDNWGRVLTIIDHQLCLAEQIFKFNEILPKHNPPHAFIMQRVLNKILLFGLTRPMQHMSDKMLMLDLLKKIHENRTIIILNHMHSPQSAEFFVCFTYALMKIMEENNPPAMLSQMSLDLQQQPVSLIERQYGHPSLSGGPMSLQQEPSSSGLLLASFARKVWDSIYQSKKGILSEALDVSLSLPAFTLDTSLDLMQLKPDIQESCECFWMAFLESTTKKPRRSRMQQKQNDFSSGGASVGGAGGFSPQGTTTSSAVNLLSGRLTRVVNAASFVSRVVGATAGTMASNVNLVGEKLTQTTTKGPARTGSKEQRAVVLTSSSGSGSSMSTANLQASGGSGQIATGSQAGASGTNHSQLMLFRNTNLNKEDLRVATQIHVSIIEDYIESHLSQKNHKLALHKYVCDEWLDIEYEILLRERAVFGPDYGSSLEKWCLDLTEGPRRMRKKMVNNTRQFYEHYPYRPEQFNPDNKSLRYRPPMSYDSHQYYLKTLDMDTHFLEVTSGGDELAIDTSTRIEDKVFENCTVDHEVKPPPLPLQQQQQQVSSECTQPIITIECSSQTSKAETEGDKLPCVSKTPSPVQSENQLALANDYCSPRPSEGDQDDGDSTSFVDFGREIEAESNSARESESIDSLSVLRLLEKNERISHMFRCSRVQGLDTYEGLLLFGREHFYLIDGFTLLKTREIKDIDSLPPDAHDPIIPNSTPNILAHSKKTCSKFSFDSVVEVHKRRYLLQPIALEIFSSDGRNALIVFPRNIRNKVYSRLMTVSTQMTSNAHETLAGQKSNVSVEGGSGLLSNLIGETSVTQRWVRGELSNFQYLMNLNTIAGRSYNDLMQYPIFPWILADYTSDQLNLDKPSTFRDLSRPVGAQTCERLDQFKRRYADWDDTETPPYHYGTFYSSAMIVASYMVRMEPFTQHFLRLQGGHFDLADRMFHSIQDSWLSASKHNMADIKELIPEFFYLPEFLKNDNKYDLGIKQSGKRLDDVILPPWAKDDTREFIRLHRCALESDYVSAHLHEWIDLIFGYKQQGPAAVEAVNVFHHLFYEGNVDIYNTDIDPIKKNAVIGFINNFGQVPKQLFKKPHPARKVSPSSMIMATPSSIPLTPILPSLSSATGGHSGQGCVFTRFPQALRQANSNFKDLRGPVGQIMQMDKNIVAVEQNKLLIPPEYCRYIAWGHADRSLRLSLYESEKPIFIWEGGDDSMAPNEILCCTIPNSRIMVTAGTDPLITVWKIEKMKSFSPMLNLYGHVEPITCLASSQAYSIIVSGSRDRTAIIWDLNRFTFVRQLGGTAYGGSGALHQGPISAIAINDSTGDIATCSSSWLYLWTINGQLLASIDSMKSLTIQQSMCHGPSTIAGNLGSQLHILCVCFSQYNEWDADEVVVTGASDGSVALWSLRYTQSPLSESEMEEAEAKRKQLECCLQTSASLKVDDEVDSCAFHEDNVAKDDKLEDNESASNELEEKNDEDISDKQQPKVVSEPINIRRGGRRRTSTMNSEWVKLSTSSTSTAGTNQSKSIDTPTPSMIEQAHELMLGATSTGSGDSFLNEALGGHTTPPKASTPQQHQTAADTITSEIKTDELDGQSLSKTNLLLEPNDPSLIKFSKSDTSLVDSFVLLGDTSPNQPLTPNQARPQSSAGAHPPKRNKNRTDSHQEKQSYSSSSSSSSSRNKLQPNHRWRLEVYLRGVLQRKNSKTLPAAVTSLAISKDHRTIYVGDASGKLASWSTT